MYFSLCEVCRTGVNHKDPTPRSGYWFSSFIFQHRQTGVGLGGVCVCSRGQTRL